MKNYIEMLEEIKQYQPKENSFEEVEKEAILKFLETYQEFAFDRNNLIAHMTSSAIIINKDKTKVLFAYHLIYKSFGWLGGHADNEFDLYEVAKKELKEESGLVHFKEYSKKPISLEILPVYAHIKKGKKVPTHLHLNVTYVFIGDETDPLTVKKDENNAVAWINISEIDKLVTEEEMKGVYKKILDKIKVSNYVS